MRTPKGTTHVVLDTPAGLHGKRLDEVMKPGAMRLPNFMMPKLLNNHGNYVISLGSLCRWLAVRAEALGVDGLETGPGAEGAPQQRRTHFRGCSPVRTGGNGHELRPAGRALHASL